MPYTRHLLATCAKCGVTTPVTELHYPATRWEPEDGEYDVEGCAACGEPFSSDTGFEQDEPPDPY